MIKHSKVKLRQLQIGNQGGIVIQIDEEKKGGGGACKWIISRLPLSGIGCQWLLSSQTRSHSGGHLRADCIAVPLPVGSLHSRSAYHEHKSTFTHIP